MKAEDLCTTQYGPDILWIFDIVQEKEPAGLKEFFIRAIGIALRLKNHTLVLAMLAETEESIPARPLHRDIAVPDQSGESLEARIIPCPLVQVGRTNHASACANHFEGRVDTVKEFYRGRCGHSTYSSLLEPNRQSSD
jgi:hypothetical protein